MSGGRDLQPCRPFFQEMCMLQTGVETLRGIGPTRAAQLQKQGVRTVEDLLHLLPRE